MQALVTGASGFIGSEVVRQLLRKGIRVRALLRHTSPRSNLEGLEYETAIGELSDFGSLMAAARGVDYVFHLAGAITARNREEFFLHNAEGTGNLARACAEAAPNLKRFVYVSSMAASGPANTRAPRLESEPPTPISHYGQSKLGGEQKLLEQSFATTILRPPAVYGPRDKAILEFVKILNFGILPVLSSASGAGEKLYSVIHVEDLVSGIILGGLAPGQSQREVLFLSGDGVHSWMDMMTAMAKGLGKRPLRVPLPNAVLAVLAGAQVALGLVLRKPFPLTWDKLKELRADYWICSNERAKKVLGFEPRWDIERGMAHTIAWYKDNKWI